MTDTLLNAVRRYAQAFSMPDGVARTPFPSLTIIRAVSPSGLDYAVSKPTACLVLQGEKQVSVGAQSFNFKAGHSLLITADVPMVSQISRATVAEPYLSLILDLDLSIISELVIEMKAAPPSTGAAVHRDQTDKEVTDAALRLMRLIERPYAMPVLQDQLLRELHYWLLAGRHGPAIRELGLPDSQAQKVARAVALLRAEFARPLRMERLAAEAGMSPSSFYQHFRAVTSLSPLQFQKQLQLIEARRLMRAEGRPASNAAFSVGYESVPQFTREYRRMFGLPPVKDTLMSAASA